MQKMMKKEVAIFFVQTLLTLPVRYSQMYSESGVAFISPKITEKLYNELGKVIF